MWNTLKFVKTTSQNQVFLAGCDQPWGWSSRPATIFQPAAPSHLRRCLGSYEIKFGRPGKTRKRGQRWTNMAILTGFCQKFAEECQLGQKACLYLGFQTDQLPVAGWTPPLDPHPQRGDSQYFFQQPTGPLPRSFRKPRHFFWANAIHSSPRKLNIYFNWK